MGENMKIRQFVIATLILAIPAMAIAGPAGPTLPEPETLALVGIGAVALVVARWRKRK